jgi:hypothetical protein
MNYDQFTYIYPPRAENAIPPSLLKAYEDKGWIAQVKKNGTNSVIFVSPEKDVFAMNRHGEDHRQWVMPEAAKTIFRTLPGKGWYVLNAELLHSKVPGIRDISYLHDILVEDGEYLLGTTYAQRYARLLMLIVRGDVDRDISARALQGPEAASHWVLDDYTWLAKNHRGGFLRLYNHLSAPEDEGIVLKKLDGRLSARNNRGWTVKCRRPQKNFQF